MVNPSVVSPVSRKETPFFSIVTPTFNRGHFLAKAIESVQLQSYANYEHIIVDDGSDDNTEELVSEYLKKDIRIIYIKQTNKGRSAARNVGIQRAVGNHICFLDSDDFWRLNHLSSFRDAIIKNDGPALFVTELTWWRENEDKEEKVVYTERDQFTSDVEFVIANEFAPNCVGISKSILETHQFSPELFINEDLELWGRIAAENRVVSISQNTAVLRVHPGNTITSEKDSISPRINVFKLQLATPSVRSMLSEGFVKNRHRSQHELLIRHLRKSPGRWRFIGQSLLFLSSYPSQAGNRSKIVDILYAIPGGAILKRLIQGSKGGKG